MIFSIVKKQETENMKKLLYGYNKVANTHPHVFWGGDRLETHKGDLHGEDGANDIEGGVGNIDTVREAAGDHKDEHVQGDDVDEEHITTPWGYLRGATPSLSLPTWKTFLTIMMVKRISFWYEIISVISFVAAEVVLLFCHPAKSESLKIFHLGQFHTL